MRISKMRISKYLHSCLLFEKDGEKLLFDPGKFSFIEGGISPALFGDVSAVVLTHDHPDHLHLAALQEIVARSKAVVIANEEVASRLSGEGIQVQVLEQGEHQVGPFSLRAIPAPHEPILSDTLPRNTAFLVNAQALNCGDSFQEPLLEFRGIPLLILPVMAPFLTELGVMDFARRMAPEAVLPVHDGYAKPFFLTQRYETYAPEFEKLGIRFHALAAIGADVLL